MDTSYYLDEIVTLMKSVLQEKLTAIYLHGSLVMGCFHPDRSDIDILVVIQDKLSMDETKELIQKVLHLHREMPNKNGIEFSIVLESSLKPFLYPTPFEFHYSPAHRDKYESDENYVCGGFEDKDLASQFAVAYERGITLYGKPIHEMIEPIDKHYFVASIVYDIQDASRDIVRNPVYLTLNLCRVLYYLTDGAVSSKKEGGEWGLGVVPESYKGLIQQCLNYYSGDADWIEVEDERLTSFAEYMQSEIRKSISQG